jgi:GT2 family glycosyltransferase
LSTVSAVIYVKNRQQTIEETLISVSKNRPSKIIIIDGDSTDDTVKICRKYTDKIYSDGGNGLGYARQLGTVKARGKYLAYIDSDVVLPNKNILRDMLEELEKNSWTAIQARIVDPVKKKSYWAEVENFRFSYSINKGSEPKFLVLDACIIKREAVVEIKFDPFFLGASEDLDFFYRLKNVGYKIGISKYYAHHHHRSTMKEFIDQRIWYGKGNARYLIRDGKYINPVRVLFTGLYHCITKKRLKYIYYYVIWSFFLCLGTLYGLNDIKNEQKSVYTKL